MTTLSAAPIDEQSTRRQVVYVAATIALIAIKLMCIGAMANRNIADFVYQGF